MPAPTGDLFPQFIRECVRPALKARGYTRAGQTYRKTQGHATAHLTLMRYTGAHAGHFDVRMSPKAAGRQVYLEGKCRAG